MEIIALVSKLDQQLIEENIEYIHSNFLDYIDHSPDFFLSTKTAIIVNVTNDIARGSSPL